MLAMVSPAFEDYDETLSTLRYAESATKIVNTCVINDERNNNNDKNNNVLAMRELRKEIELLRSQVKMLQENARVRIENETPRETLPIYAPTQRILSPHINACGKPDANANARSDAPYLSLHGQLPCLINLDEDLVHGDPLALYLQFGWTFFGTNRDVSSTGMVAVSPGIWSYVQKHVYMVRAKNGTLYRYTRRCSTVFDNTKSSFGCVCVCLLGKARNQGLAQAMSPAMLSYGCM